MFSLLSIISSVGIFLLIPIKAENSEPFCTPSNKTIHPLPEYEGFNHKRLPINLPIPEEIKTLQLWDINGSNNLQVLKNGELFATKTTNLEVLILSKCKLKEVEKGTFRGGNKLTLLGLSHNQIEELDLSVFDDLPTLQKLYLHDNPLTTFLHNSTFPHGSITFLKFSDCRLRSINKNIFENLVNLKELYIHGNQLTTLDWNLLHSLKKLQQVSLFENPFHCDCQIKFLLDYLQKRNIEWNLWDKKPSCSSSTFDNYIHIESAEKFNQQLIFVDWDSINRQYLVCPPKIDSLEKTENTKNISVKCKYSGYPEPTILWRINGEILQVDNRNKHLIDTRAAGEMEKPEYNYEFVQTLFISLLPLPTPSLGKQVTCQATGSVFKSTESNKVTVTFQNIETATNTTPTLETGGVSTKQENSNQVILIIAAVILVAAVFVVILCRKHFPCNHCQLCRGPRPPVEDNPARHAYDYIGTSWIHKDGYETPPPVSIQRLPLPPIPQQDPGAETNNESFN